MLKILRLRIGAVDTFKLIGLQKKKKEVIIIITINVLFIVMHLQVLFVSLVFVVLLLLSVVGLLTTIEQDSKRLSSMN